MKVIYCPNCGHENFAWLMYGVSTTGHDRTPRWWNRCSKCRVDYATIPPGNEERKLQRRLEAAGQMRIPGA